MAAVHKGRAILLMLGLLALMGASWVAAGSALAAEPPENYARFGPDGTPGSNFAEVDSVAVDQQTGDVYVLDGVAGILYKFKADGQPLGWGGTAPYISGAQITGLAPNNGERRESQVAVDSTTHVVYVTESQSIRAFQATGEPANFSAGPGAGTSEISGFSKLLGLAVDGNGAIYASDEAGTVSVYAPTGEPLTTFTTSTSPSNLTVDSDGAVYVVPRGPFEEIKKAVPSAFPVTSSTTYTVTAPIGPESGQIPVGIGADPVTNDVYVVYTNFGEGWIVEYDESGNLIGSFGETSPGLGEFGDLAQGIALVGGGEEFQFYLGNTSEKEGTSRVEIFGEEIIEDRPGIESTSVTSITSSSATLRAVVNPHTFATTYRFEFGLSDCAVATCTSVPLGGAGIGAGHRGVAVSQNLPGLQAGTTYHYRVVAVNSKGPMEGPGGTFTTQVSGLGFQLADRRAWEMVSPPNKHAARLLGSNSGLIQAAAGGNGLAYVTVGSLEAEPEGSRTTSIALARWSAQGWHSKDIAPPNIEFAPPRAGELGEYRLFNSELSRGVTDQNSETPLSPEASEQSPYLRENSEPEPATYTPLVTDKEGFANVPPGTKFGGSVIFAGASGDLGHVVVASEAPLVKDAGAGALYEWAGGQLQPVSELPLSEGGVVVRAVVGVNDIESGNSVRHAVSEDGSRVFWTASKQLYLRDTEAGETARLDLGGAGTAGAVFQGASADGHVVFFTDEEQLTADASPKGSDLYRCEIPLGATPPACATLTDLSAPAEGSGESAEALGFVSGLSEDGTRLYFVAKGVLDSSPNQFGDSAVPGGPNLYLWQEGEGPRYVATLSKEDGSDWGTLPGIAGDWALSTASSPSGRYFAFTSVRRLTGYDNRDAASGEEVQEAFRYDAAADPADRLQCVSCNPTGARPIGRTLAFSDKERLVDPKSLWNGRRVAATLPEATTAYISGPSFYRPRAVLDNGRVFFNAIDSLVASDSNGQWDVYQYEPTGVGDCTGSSGGAAVSRAAGGCVSLISSGTAEKEAAFMDASASGDDVFFLTPARLSVTDEDHELDAYDARVEGVPATLTPITECLGEACQPPPSAPNDPTPASAAFNGAGNVHPRPHPRCPKGKRLVRGGGRTHCTANKHQRRHSRADRNRGVQR